MSEYRSYHAWMWRTGQSVGARLGAKTPCLVRFQEALPSEELLGLRLMSGNQEGG